MALSADSADGNAASELVGFEVAPARTDEEVAVLLAAVVSKFAQEGESKWARVTEEFNARAAEKRSKQWIKRQAAKLVSPPLASPLVPPKDQVGVVQQAVQVLQDWLSSHGVKSKVEGVELTTFGLSLVATADIAAGDVLMSLPQRLHLNLKHVAQSVLDGPIKRAGVGNEENTVLALGLMREFASGARSAWSPWLNTLPRPEQLHLPLLWSDEELKRWLGGSYLAEYVANFQEVLREQWKALVECGIAKAFSGKGIDKAWCTFERFVYAHALVMSRAHRFNGDLALIPFLDLSNSTLGSPNACSIGTVPCREGSPGKELAAVVTAGRAHALGEQVFIDYGEAQRSGWEMLHMYGFVPGDTLSAWQAIGSRAITFEGLRTCDALVSKKRAILTALGCDSGGHDDDGAGAAQLVEIKPEEAQLVAMAPLLRLAHLSPESHGPLAAKLASGSITPDELWDQLEQPISVENEQLVAAQIIRTCDDALGVLPSFDDLIERTIDDGSVPVHGRLAAQVMLGEMHVLNKCREHWLHATA